MTRTTSTPYCTERRIFFSALALFLILFCAYVYFVSASIVHVIARKDIDREIAHLNSRIGDLEATYIATQESITEENLPMYGFVPGTPEKIYVRKSPTDLVLLGHDES